MTAENKKIIDTILHSFETYALGDIKFLQQNGKPIAAFILSTCFIEQLSHFIYGPSGKDKYKSMQFINEYINEGKQVKYNASDLVDILRNKLVHNYSLSDTKKNFRNKYALNYDNPKTHLHEEHGTVHVNIDCFVVDIEQGFLLYKKKIHTDLKLVKNAIDQFNRSGILVHQEIKLFNIKK